MRRTFILALLTMLSFGAVANLAEAGIFRHRHRERTRVVLRHRSAHGQHAAECSRCQR